MKDAIVRLCIKNNTLTEATKELNRYSLYITNYKEYEDIHNSIKKHYEEKNLKCK